MRRLFKALGLTFFWLVAALLAAIITVPPFLDRLYYEGPASAHYDGARFLNPDDPSSEMRTPKAWRTTRFLRFFAGAGRLRSRVRRCG